MACCVVAALLFGSMRRLLRRLTPGATPDLAFAPPARRSAPGTPGPAPATTRPHRELHASAPPTLRPVLLGLALGTLTYAVGVDLLAAAEAVRVDAHLARTLGLALVVAALGLWAHACPPVGAGQRRPALPVVLAAVGAAWSAAGVVEMHAFASIELASHTLLPDLAFHGSGLALALAALTLLPRDRRPAQPAPAPAPRHEEVSA